jgi:hypothetical protein
MFELFFDEGGFDDDFPLDGNFFSGDGNGDGYGDGDGDENDDDDDEKDKDSVRTGTEKNERR